MKRCEKFDYYDYDTRKNVNGEVVEDRQGTHGDRNHGRSTLTSETAAARKNKIPGSIYFS